jgi:tol-pal system protein YbgF
MRVALSVVLLALTVAVAAPAAAQQTVADVKAELGLLGGQIAQLRNELVRTGAAGGLPSDPATALTRVDQLEAELRRLTDQVDVLTNDIRRIVDDASNKVGDLEFRVTELEGGDTSILPDTPEPLGGGVTGPRPRPVAASVAPARTGQLAVSEQADFDAAKAAAEAGDNAKAVQLFGAFLEDYPGGPLSTEAQFRLGEAHAASADWRGAAHSFLDAFSGAPQGPFAPRALFRLASSLKELGNVNEACLTLTEVASRYPGSAEAADVPAERQAFGCP